MTSIRQCTISITCIVREGNLDKELLICTVSQEPVKHITQNIFLLCEIMVM